jgi:FkbM family methyltransferase
LNRISSEGNPGVEGPFTSHDYNCTNGKKIQGLVKNVKKVVCMDNWEGVQMRHKGKPCVAYDLGVRTDSEFALNAVNEFGCVVRAYDPSETTATWWENKEHNPFQNPEQQKDMKKLRAAEQDGTYKMYRAAVTENDGTLELFKYNWQQVSVFRASDETQGKQEKFVVPAKSFSTMLKENQDTFVDILKVDIEGSEFSFLKGMLKEGCPPIEHMLFEWHSQNMDFKEGCPPEVVEVEAKLRACGYKKYDHYPFWKEPKPTSEEKFKIDATYYGHSSYCLTCGGSSGVYSSKAQVPIRVIPLEK